MNDQVKGMASLVINSQRLSSFHEHNLKMYGLIYFNSKELSIDYDLSVRHDADTDEKSNVVVKTPLQHCFVAYHFKVDENANDNLEKRFEALEQSVRALFWKDLSVEVYFNDKIVYKSKKYERRK